MLHNPWEYEGNVEIQASNAAILNLMEPLLKEFKEKYPLIEITLATKEK